MIGAEKTKLRRLSLQSKVCQGNECRGIGPPTRVSEGPRGGRKRSRETARRSGSRLGRHALFLLFAFAAALSASGCGAGAPRGAAAPAGESGPSRAGLVQLHIDAAGPGISLAGAATCPAPCDREIDGRGGARFFLRGPDMPSSMPFGLTGMSGPVTARVLPGSAPLRIGGFVLFGLGLYGLLSALESAVVGAIVAEVSRSPRDAEPWFVSGAVAAGAGAGLTALGAWLASRGRTTFELVPTAPAPSR